jgi:hypothetical protein
LVPVTQTAVGTGIAVFVGYADSVRAAGDFPNPWVGSPNVTFDGCTPASACTFDAGAVRVENQGAAPVKVDQVTVHLGACVRTWKGSLYPVTLAPAASLVVTQRAAAPGAGCVGSDPSSFDSSDIPSITCGNDGIQATVDVAVDGVTSTGTDTGQVLNTGGIDPAVCTNTNESTEWVRIGSAPCPGQGLSLAPANQIQSVGTSATVTATFANACGSPLSGVLTRFNVISGPNAGLTGTGITDASGQAAFTYSSLLPGTDSLQATVTNSVGFTTNSNTVAVTWTVEFAPGGGSFVIGNQNATIGNVVNFWGSQWAKRNSLSGGPAPRSFKGFAEEPDMPSCGKSWTADPGNSTPPPDGALPPFMGVIVTSSARQTGSTTSGDIAEIVIVRTDPGYEPNPGHSATGTVVAVLCHESQQAASGPPPSPSLSPNAASNGSSSVSSTAGQNGCPSGGSLDRPAHGHATSVDLPAGKQRGCTSRSHHQH